ncbi:MAG: NAD(+)/NADH kinase [Planctomycetia bacterium]|nr:NAD(+)/NADH kinase [Planctomycetia bacterium]
MKALLLGNGSRQGVLEQVHRLWPEMEKLIEIVDSDFSGKKDMSNSPADFAIVFGGDGALLRAVHQLGVNQIPILAVNLGTLGFLASMPVDKLIDYLKTTRKEDFSIRNQILLECSIWRNKKNFPKDFFFNPVLPSLESKENDQNEICIEKRLVVNEVAIQGGPPFEILKIELLIDDESVTTYHGDGLIISTPVGSTAHNLSSGGPILRKDLDVVVISPISPHTLSYRPVVDSANRSYEIRVVNREVYVVIDGDSSLTIIPGDRVLIRKWDHYFKMIRVPGRSHYLNLREKLGWSGKIEVSK